MRKHRISICLALWLLLSAAVPTAAARELVPVGRIVGLELKGGGISVAAYEDTWGENARAAGLQIGDKILSIDDRAVANVQDIRNALNAADGDVRITVSRNGRRQDLVLEPAITKQGPRLGVYIRDSVAGIGTVTWFDPATGRFGALGHGINAEDGNPAAMRAGIVYRARVVGVKQGCAGQPGQLRGSVDGSGVLGSLEKNTGQGVFGTVSVPWEGRTMPLASCSEVREGDAVIRSNVSGESVREYKIRILKVYNRNSNNRNMLLEVTDPALLAVTGGIVQGMSGSPIIQDGKLVGAVTHVLVNDPTTGYGIFIENMLDAAA